MLLECDRLIDHNGGAQVVESRWHRHMLCTHYQPFNSRVVHSEVQVSQPVPRSEIEVENKPTAKTSAHSD